MRLLTILVCLAIGDGQDSGQVLIKGSKFIWESGEMVAWLGMKELSDQEKDESNPEGERHVFKQGIREFVIMVVMWYWA